MKTKTNISAGDEQVEHDDIYALEYSVSGWF